MGWDVYTPPPPSAGYRLSRDLITATLPIRRRYSEYGQGVKSCYALGIYFQILSSI